MATHGEFMSAAFACKTPDEATAFVEQSVADVLALRPELIREEARSIVMDNIGYLSGYCDREEAARILQLFDTRHPIFGAIDEWPSTPKETIELGVKIGSRMKRAS